MKAVGKNCLAKLRNMHKCRLCQQMFNNLTNIYNNRLKSLTQIILKLKGFKDSWNINDLALCGECIIGVENVGLFWENIPEAKKDNSIPTDVFDKLELENANVSFRTRSTLPAITSATEEENNCFPLLSTEVKLEPIKIRLKLPRKRRETTTSSNTSTKEEPKQKRIRRCPKRYEDFHVTLKDNAAERSKTIVQVKLCDKKYFKNLPQVALLRLDNGQIIGTVAESERKGKIRISCQDCSEVFRVEKKFQQHMKTHFTKDPDSSKNVLKNYLFHCKLCDKSFNKYRAVRRHYKFAHTEERLFKCLHCEASFKYRFNLKYHMSTKHVPKKGFECTFCNKKFFRQYELQIHIRSHTKERPYKCEFCTFASAHKSNLKTHLKVQHFENLNTDGAKILKKLFKPPDALIEQETEIFNNLSASKVSDSTIKSLVRSGDSVMKNELPKLTESLLEQETVFRYDLNDENITCSTEIPFQSEQFKLTESIQVLKYDSHQCSKENISTEQFKPPQTVVEQECLFQFDINDKNIADTILATFENYIENLEGESIENSVNETEEPAETETNTREDDIILKPFENYIENLDGENIENSVNEAEEPAETIIQSETETNSKEDVILRAITNERSEGFLRPQANLNFFQLDSSLLKVLPSTSLLGLKKWPKFFQSTPNKELQLVKRSSLFSNEKPNIFERKKTPIDCREKSDVNFQHVQSISADHSTSLIKYKTLQENENSETTQRNVSNNTSLKLPHTFVDFNTKTNFEDTTSNSNKLIHITKPAEYFSTELEQKSKNEMNKNKTQNSSANYANDFQPYKDIKVSSRPIKIKNILHSKQSNNPYKDRTADEKIEATSNNFSANENLANKSIKNTHNSSKDFLVPDSSLKPFQSSSDTTNRSLLKPVIKNPQTSTLSLTNCSGPKQTVLPYKPLITKIEILPPLKSITNLSSKPTNLIKPPSDYKFQCPYCYKYFKQKSPLSKHLRTHTGEKPYKCNLCSKAYGDASNYKKHKILHRNAAEALNINRTTAPAASYAVQSSPAYSTVSDPDPDGIEVMQTLKKFESSSTEDDDEIDDNNSTSSYMETQMWSDALDQALNSEELKEQIRRNLFGINNAILPKSMQQIANTIEHFSTENPD